MWKCTTVQEAALAVLRPNFPSPRFWIQWTLNGYSSVFTILGQKLGSSCDWGDLGRVLLLSMLFPHEESSAGKSREQRKLPHPPISVCIAGVTVGLSARYQGLTRIQLQWGTAITLAGNYSDKLLSLCQVRKLRQFQCQHTKQTVKQCQPTGNQT